MWKLSIFLYLCVLEAILIAGANVDLISKDLVNKNVERSIDLTSQLVKITAKVSIENVGKTPSKYFLVAIDPSAVEKLSFITVKDSSKRDVRVTESTVRENPGIKFWRAELKEALQPGKVAMYQIDTVFSKALAPFPSSITQKEKQLVKYFGNHYFYSPYTTATQKTSVTLSSRNIENYSKLKPVTQSDASITYGPYDNIAAFNTDELTIHYENNSPFLTVTKVERTIELSHWGNIAVEETIDMYHSGALLKGSFSRYEYQQDSSSGQSSVKSYRTVLPAAASRVYYRDPNGNISTSHLRSKKDAVELELRPRFPLLGGWRTHYTLGYDVPSYEYLYHSGDRYLLKMRMIDHIYDDMAVDEIVTRVILPEGCTDIKLTPPYPVTRHPDTAHFTYLDTKGRTVISFSKKNLVENHIQDFQLRYSFPRILMLQEPILVVIFLYILFLCVIVYVRLDFSIHKEENHKE